MPTTPAYQQYQYEQQQSAFSNGQATAYPAQLPHLGNLARQYDQGKEKHHQFDGHR